MDVVTEMPQAPLLQGTKKKNCFRKHPVLCAVGLLLLSAVVFTTMDLVILKVRPAKFQSVSVNLLATPEADSEMLVEGLIGSKFTSHSYEVKHLDCSIASNGDDNLWTPLFNIVSAPNNDVQQAKNEIKMKLHMKDMDFSAMRDVVWKTRQIKMGCQMQTQVNIFGLIPVDFPLEIPVALFEPGMPIGEHMAFSWGDEDLTMKDSIKAALRNVGHLANETIELNFAEEFQNKIEFPFSVDSFTVEVPSLSYSIHAVPDVPVEWVVSTKAFVLELAQDQVLINTKISLDLECGEDFTKNSLTAFDADGEPYNCHALDPFYFNKIFLHLQDGKIDADLTYNDQENVISNLVGTHHTVTAEVSDTTLEEMFPEQKRRLLQDWKTAEPKDASLNAGFGSGGCLDVKLDGTIQTNLCSYASDTTTDGSGLFAVSSVISFLDDDATEASEISLQLYSTWAHKAFYATLDFGMDDASIKAEVSSSTNDRASLTVNVNDGTSEIVRIEGFSMWTTTADGVANAELTLTMNPDVPKSENSTYSRTVITTGVSYEDDQTSAGRSYEMELEIARDYDLVVGEKTLSGSAAGRFDVPELSNMWVTWDTAKFEETTGDFSLFLKDGKLDVEYQLAGVTGLIVESSFSPDGTEWTTIEAHSIVTDTDVSVKSDTRFAASLPDGATNLEVKSDVIVQTSGNSPYVDTTFVLDLSGSDQNATYVSVKTKQQLRYSTTDALEYVANTIDAEMKQGTEPTNTLDSSASIEKKTNGDMEGVLESKLVFEDATITVTGGLTYDDQVDAATAAAKGMTTSVNGHGLFMTLTFDGNDDMDIDLSMDQKMCWNWDSDGFFLRMDSVGTGKLPVDLKMDFTCVGRELDDGGITGMALMDVEGEEVMKMDAEYAWSKKIGSQSDYTHKLKSMMVEMKEEPTLNIKGEFTHTPEDGSGPASTQGIFGGQMRVYFYSNSVVSGDESCASRDDGTLCTTCAIPHSYCDDLCPACTVYTYAEEHVLSINGDSKYRNEQGPPYSMNLEITDLHMLTNVTTVPVKVLDMDFDANIIFREAVATGADGVFDVTVNAKNQNDQTLVSVKNELGFKDAGAPFYLAEAISVSVMSDQASIDANKFDTKIVFVSELSAEGQDPALVKVELAVENPLNATKELDFHGLMNWKVEDENMYMLAINFDMTEADGTVIGATLDVKEDVLAKKQTIEFIATNNTLPQVTFSHLSMESETKDQVTFSLIEDSLWTEDDGTVFDLKMYIAESDFMDTIHGGGNSGDGGDDGDDTTEETPAISGASKSFAVPLSLALAAVVTIMM